MHPQAHVGVAEDELADDEDEVVDQEETAGGQVPDANGVNAEKVFSLGVHEETVAAVSTLLKKDVKLAGSCKQTIAENPTSVTDHEMIAETHARMQKITAALQVS